MRSLPWLTLSVLALAASDTRAQTQEYQRTLVPGRPFCVVWPGRDYLYRIDAAGSSRTPGDSEFSAIDAAVASWRAVSATCSDFTFTRGPNIEHPRVGYDKDHPDNNENVLTFREVDCNDVVPPGDACLDDDTCGNKYACWVHGAATIGLTTTTFSFRTGYILDADIEFNAGANGRGFTFTTVDSPLCDGGAPSECVITDVQNTVTHELGHVVGLDHVSVPGSTMEPTAPPGETHKRIIDAGSAQGFCDAYPRGLPPTQCGERPDLGRHFQTVSTGTGMGCGAAPESLLPAAALLGALALGRRRERAGGRAEAAPRVPRG